MVKPLELHCINYLLANLNAENVLTILQFCIDCQTDTRLMDECRKFIQIHTKNVVEAESFKEISHECLTLLLTQSSLDISEVSLFEAVRLFFLILVQIFDTYFCLGCSLGKIGLRKIWEESKCWQKPSLKNWKSFGSYSFSSDEHQGVCRVCRLGFAFSSIILVDIHA